MDIDGVFSDIGELGPFQVKILAAFCVISMWTAAHMIHMVFIGATFPYTCGQISSLGCLTDRQACHNVTFQSNGHTSIVTEVYASLAVLHTWAAFHMVQVVFIGATPSFTCNAGARGIVTGCPDDSLTCVSPVFTGSKFTSIASEWNLICGDGYKSSLVQSIFMAGVLCGALLFGSLSDRYGRRSSLFACMGGVTLLSLIGAFAPSYVIYCALRFSAGFFCGGLILVSFVLATEVVGSSKRALCGMIIPAVFAIGIALFAFTAYFIRQWRTLSVVAALPGFVGFFYLWFMPESPRWLLAQNHVSDAEDVLRHIASGNQGAPYTRTIRLRPLAKQEGETYGLKDIISRSSLRTMTAVQVYAWFVNSAVYYGLTMSAGNLGSNPFVSVALAGLVELPAYIITFLILDRVGRRLTFCVSMLMGGVSCLAILMTPKGATGMVTSLALIGKLAISASFAVAYIYSAELYPTVIRNNAMGVCSMAARMGGIVSPLIVPLGTVLPNLQFVVFGGLSLTAGLISIRLPETLNRPMPETLDDLEKTSRSKYLVQPPELSEDQVRLMEGDILEKEKQMGEEGGLV